MQSFSKDSPSLSVSWRHGQSMFRKAANDFFYFLLCYISTKPTMTPKPISCFPFPGRTSLDDWARSCMVSAVSLWPKSDVAETTASWAQSADPTAHLWWKKRRFLVIIFFHQKQFSAGFVSQNDPRLCPIKKQSWCTSRQLSWAQCEKSQEWGTGERHKKSFQQHWTVTLAPLLV